MQKIKDQQIINTLNRMHREASGQGFVIMKGLAKGLFRKLRPEDMEEAYIAISRSQGEFLYDLLLQKKAKNIVEFGTSFGLSTIYLGAAAKENGGHVVTSEILPKKCEVAQSNFQEAKLDAWIDLREGDALETLQSVEDGIDFLLLDGWNDLYLPLMKLLEPKLNKGALIYTDNASFSSAKPYINYVRSQSDRFRTTRLKDDKGGSELTEFIG